MALIDCPECKKQVSDTALACPHCGYSLKTKPAEQTTDRQAMIVVGLLVAGVIFLLTPQLFYFRILVPIFFIGALAALFYPQIKKMLK